MHQVRQDPIKWELELERVAHSLKFKVDCFFCSFVSVVVEVAG